MKKLLFVALAATTMYGCGSGSGYTVSGKLSAELLGDSVYLLNMDRTVIASAAADSFGEFTIENEIEVPTTALLAGGDMQPFMMMFLENGDINISTNAEGGYTASGTTSNDIKNDVDAKLLEITDAYKALGEGAAPMQEDSLELIFSNLITNAVAENMDNIYGVNLFVSQEFSNMPIADAKILMDKFPAELQQTPQLVTLRERVVILEKTEIGQPYTDINLLDVDGKELPLSSVVGAGKWVLLDFWATWCPPCIKEIPFLLADYKEFKDRGFDIYGVSLDRNADAWKEYIKEHTLVWPNVLNSSDSSATKDYAVQSIPTNLLISPEGIIVAKNLRGEALKEKLVELLK